MWHRDLYLAACFPLQYSRPGIYSNSLHKTFGPIFMCLQLYNYVFEHCVYRDKYVHVLELATYKF